MTRVDPIRQLLRRQPVVILDGGLATELERRGLALDDRLWSAGVLLDRPEAIERLHRDYLEAGADCIVSASYQASFEGLEGRGLTRAAAESTLRHSVGLALSARESFWETGRGSGRARPLVAASVGPYGACLADGSEYVGDYRLGVDELYRFHRRRLHVLADSGADLLACETVPSRAEALVLGRLIEETPDVAAWISFSCRDGERIGDGTPLAAVVRELEPVAGIVAIGVNCTAPRHVASLLRHAAGETGKPLVAYPNSGEAWDAVHRRWIAADSGFELAAASEWHAIGARVIGGCCRTGPDDVRSLRRKLLAESRH